MKLLYVLVCFLDFLVIYIIPLINIESELDLLQIGHFLGWKNIKCPKILSIVSFANSSRYRYEDLLDYNYHPQVIKLIIVDAIVFVSCAIVLVLVHVFYFVYGVYSNKFLMIFELVLFLLYIIRFIGFKIANYKIVK